MNSILDIFMADYKPKAGFCLNMTFKLCMAPGARKFFCGVTRNKQKKTQDDEMSAGSKHTKSASAKEKDLEEGIQMLQSIYGDDYDCGQCRLWARMIKNNQWKDFNSPPNVPMITEKVSRKDKSGTSTNEVDTIATAAVAIIKEIKGDATKGMGTSGVMSPGKKVELRSQYLKQVTDIQNPKDEGVLTLEEFQAEQFFRLSNDSNKVTQVQLYICNHIAHAFKHQRHLCKHQTHLYTTVLCAIFASRKTEICRAYT